MSIFNTQNAATKSIGQAADELVSLQKRGDVVVGADDVGALLSLESATPTARSALVASGRNIQNELKGLFAGDAAADSVALEAAQIAFMGAASANRYQAKALATAAMSMEGANVIMPTTVGIHGAMDVSFTDVAMEAFDNRDLTVVAAYSAAWNYGAARQDNYAEGFYPTVVQTPDQVAVVTKVPVIRVFKGAQRALSGDVKSWNFKNILEAYRDSKLLDAPSTALIPHVQADNSNLNKFVAASLVAPVAKEVNGVTYNTAPIAIGVAGDLLALSQNPAALEGTYDQTDQIQEAITVSAVYVRVANGAGTEVGVVKFPTANLKRFEMYKAPAGDAYELTLSAMTSELAVDKDTKNPAGAQPAPLSDLNTTEFQIHLDLSLSGSVNVQTGHYKFDGSVSAGKAYHRVTKDLISPADATLAPILADLVFTVVGIDLKANRINSNRRTAGLLLDRGYKTDYTPIPVGAPISVQVPTTEENVSVGLDDLVNATRIATSNRAIAAQLNYLEGLKAFCAQNKHLIGAGADSSASLEGAGRWLVTPFYAEVALDLFAQVQTLRSTDRVADLNSLILNTVREVAYRAVVESNYLPALQQVSGGAEDKPTLLLGTDINLQQYMMIQGDPRTAGIGMDFEVLATPDVRMQNKIIGTFTRKGRSGFCPLSSGNHYWIPELVSTGPVSRGNATYNQLSVQPRNVHVHNLPVWFVINVTNLDKALVALKAVPTKEQA